MHAYREREDWIERLAFGASLLCLLHCLALPLLFAALPALVNVLHLPQAIHVWILIFAVPTSSTALFLGRVRHRAILPMVIGGLGLILLTIGAILFGGTDKETPLTVTGSLALAGAHILNWRWRHRPPGHG